MRRKNIIQKTAYLLLAAATLTSCAKNDTPEIDNGEDTPSTLLLITEAKLNGETLTRYEYNAQNQLIVVHTYLDGKHTSTAEYTYDDRGRLLVVTNTLVDGSAISTVEYVYAGNDDKPVSAVTTTHVGEVVQWDIIYSYSDNRLTETIIQPAPAPELVTVYTYTDKGDISLIETSLGGTWAGTTEYGDYDDKNSPSILGNPFAWKVPSRHNHRSLKSTGPEGVTEDKIYKYTYNDSGYPVKTEIYNRGEDEVLQTIETSYKKAN
ncbi:hypothetical protein [Parapedobacter soli]|uniref:hypothetical protein n=1 Tax=Parapedobacter soli TaxID=416955 RepID=UPI0021C6BA3B|nr:hypothetical protein [Parapedobacter soli]